MIDLDPTDRALVYRVAQEALRNVAAHAGARRVSVVLRPATGEGGGGGVELLVDDDGQGFEVDDLEARGTDGHVGLRVMADVAAASGAELVLASAPGAGTAVRLTVLGGSRTARPPRRNGDR